jgi:EmrB/QacA subfamily drug resistance transporter
MRKPSTEEPSGIALEKSALIVTTVTSFLGPFMISAVNVALPAIQKEFSADAVMLSWIATAYLLSTAIFLVPFGKLGDTFGRKKVFTWGLFLFVLSSFFLAFAVSIAMIIGLRVVQGLGAAMIVTTGMAVLTSVFPPHRRGGAIGLYVAAVYVGLSVGPFAGGVLTHHFSWRSIFLLTTPLGVACIVITLKYLKGEWKDDSDEAFDSLGSLLYAGSVFCLVYGSTLLPKVSGIVLAGFGALIFLAFLRQELRVRNPVFEVRLFRHNRLFAFSSAAALINYSATFAVSFLLSLYLQYTKGLNPQSAGTVLIAQPIMQAVFSPLTGKLSDRFEPRILASIGMAMCAAGLFWLVFLKASTPISAIVTLLVFMGSGFALFSSPNMNAIMGSVDKKYFGVASGTVGTMRLLGQITSMAIATIAFSLFVGRAEIKPSNLPEFLASVRVCFMIFTVLCITGIFFSFSRGNLRD